MGGEISKVGCGPSTNTILNDAEHDAGVLARDVQVKTGGMKRTGPELLADRNAAEMDLHHRMQEALDHATRHQLVHGLPPAIGALATPIEFALLCIEETHADWKAGQAAKQAMVNDVADLALSTGLDYAGSFKASQFERRAHVSKAAEKTRMLLDTKPESKALLQARSDQGFLAAQKAAEDVRGLPPEQRRDAMMTTLQRSSASTIEHDAAFAKGVEYFLHCQSDPALLQSESARIGARNFTRPPSPCRV